MTSSEIKTLRQDLKLPLSDFGKLFGVAPNTAFRWENGQSQPPDMVIVAMHQLRQRVDNSSGKTDEIVQKIGKMVLFGGLAAFIIWLFNKEE
jgi:transcriptional regulator with XRE-family HTH domain